MADGNWRAGAWYLERRFPDLWRPSADKDGHDQEDTDAAYAIDQAADEELLAKLERIAEVAKAQEHSGENAAAGTCDPGEKHGWPAETTSHHTSCLPSTPSKPP
ncbi:MAG: hypothetical protein OXG37_04605, partial [Actinomycetia bacterium]|nr:hypothetical protein [Actinomycetes bacterium]